MEQKLARLAAGSYGVVTRTQLLDAAISQEAIRQRLRSGALLREHPGVYRVGHRAPSTEASYLAAVWACGPRALLCGHAAAHLFGLVRGAAPVPEVVATTKRRLRGVKTRRSRALCAEDGCEWRRIPVTTVAKTIVDIAGSSRTDELARAFHEAGVRYGTSPAALMRVLERRPNAPGARELRRVISGDERVTLSKLENFFIARLSDANLPLPETNRKAGSYRVDCRWPERRLTVELDSYRYHGSRHAWEQDRRREREAYARGDDLRRYTWGDVVERPGPMLAELKSLLRGHRPT